MPIAGSVLCSWVLASLSTLKDPVQYISVIYTRRGARQYCICWFQKELSWRLGTLHIFLGIKTFLFVKIESCDFQHLFDLEFREKYTKVKANQTTFTEKNFLLGIKVIWMSWNFERFHEIKIEKKIRSTSCQKGFTHDWNIPEISYHVWVLEISWQIWMLENSLGTGYLGFPVASLY